MITISIHNHKSSDIFVGDGYAVLDIKSEEMKGTTIELFFDSLDELKDWLAEATERANNV